jgi:hypothetical protein
LILNHLFNFLQLTTYTVAVWLNPEKGQHDVTGRNKYVKVCGELGVTPVTSYVDSLQNKEISLKFYGLSMSSAKAISVPLEVGVTGVQG